jgi:hypothetical protein
MLVQRSPHCRPEYPSEEEESFSGLVDYFLSEARRLYREPVIHIPRTLAKSQ